MRNRRGFGGRIVSFKSALSMALVIGAATLVILANSEYASPEFDPKHSGSFTSPNEWIDNFSGGLNIVDKDVILKGPDGFDLTVTRWYSSKINQWDSNCILQGREVGPLGVGWQIHQGRLWDNPASPFTAVPAYRLELPGGVQQPFYANNVLGVPNADYVSPGGWSLRDAACVGEVGQCWIASSPSGTEYHFPKSASYRMDPDDSYLYVRTILDLKGNQQTVDYDFGCNCNQAHILSVTDTWGRSVNFNYTDGGPPGPKVCSLDPGEICTTDLDCQGYCSGGGTTTPCTSDFQCGEGTCSDDGQPCNDQYDCDRNCSNNPSVSCTTGLDCGSSSCVGGQDNGSPCQTNLDCDNVCQGGGNPGAYCNSGSWQCTGICQAGTNPGSSCTSDSTCGALCQGGSDAGDTCNFDSQCGGICQAGGNPGTPCNSNSTCTSICQGGSTPGQSCSYDSQCGNICQGGSDAGDSCSYDSQCGGICTGGGDQGDSCSSDYQCSNVCSNNHLISCSSDYACGSGNTCLIGSCSQGSCSQGTCSQGSCSQGTCAHGTCASGTCIVGICPPGPTCEPQPTCDNPGVCLDSVCLPGSTGPRYLESITVAWVNGTATYQYTVNQGLHIDPVLQSFQTPAGQTTSYDYAPGPGEANHDLELKAITLPTGSTIDYDYADHQFHYPLRNTGNGIECTRVVTSKSLGTSSWTFDWPTGEPNDRTTIVTDPHGAMRKYTYFRYADTGPNRIWKAGLLEKLQIVEGGTVFLDESYTYEPQQISSDNISPKSGYTEFAQVARMTVKDTVQNPGNKTSRVETGGFDAYGNPAWQEEYGYSGSLYRRTEYEYAHQSATFENAHVVDHPTLIRTETAGGSKVAEVINTYDTTTGGGNAFGNLDSSQTWTGSGYVTETFQYDSKGDMTQRQVSGGGVTRTTDFVYTRGELDRVIDGGRTLFDRTIDLNSSLVTAEQSANGGTTSFGYDNGSRLTSIDPPGSDPTTTLNYSATTVLVDRGTGQSLYFYDGYGRLKKHRTRIEGTKHTYDLVNYDARGEVVRQYEPSHLANPTVFTSFNRDALGRPMTANGPDGNTTFTYTGNETTINDGVSTRVITYDAFGRVTQVREGGYTTGYEYDERDNLVRVDNPGTSADRVFTWSAAGWLISESHPETGLIQYGVNGIGERISKTNSDGQTEYYSYDAEGRTTVIDRPGTDNDVHFYYDGDAVPSHSASYTNASGYLTGMTDATGSTVWADRDIHGRVQRIEHKRDSVLYVTEMQYDSQGNLSLVDYPKVGATSRSVVTYSYNDAGLVNGVWLNGEPIVDDVQYSPLMTPDVWIYSNGVTVNAPTSESERNRPTAIYTAGATSGGSNADVSLSFGYNSRGQVSSINRNGSIESYSYEPDRGFLTSVSYGGAGINYGYDAAGNMTNRSSGAYPALAFTRSHTNNRIAGCSYSNSGNLLSCDGHNYSYTTNAKIKSADGAVQFTYDGNDRLGETLVTGENRLLVDFHADVLGRLSRFAGPAGGALEPEKDWIYAAGQLVTSVDYQDNCACQPLTCSDQNITCGTTTDGCGNSIYCGKCGGGGGGGGCVINSGDVNVSLQEVMQQTSSGNGIETDGITLCNGLSGPLGFNVSVDYGTSLPFMTMKSIGTIPAEVGYQIPISFSAKSLDRGRYSATITLTFDDPAIVPVDIPVQFDVTKAVKDQTGGDSEPTLLANVSTPETYLRWYVADHRGSTMLVLDEAGEAIAGYEYFPFGEIKAQSSCSDDEGVYQGSLRDPYSNLYDLGVRHHSPHFARFMVPDVVWPDLRLPTDWNLYLYSSNDPINLIDLLGYETTTKNGGFNTFRNVDLYDDPRGYQMVLEVAANAIGDTVSDLLALDVIADGVALAGDSSNSVGQRAWGATKAAGVAAMDIAGGAIIKKGVGIAGRLAGVFSKGEKLAQGAVRGGAAAVRVGQAGEAAVRSVANIGAKSTIRVAGRARIPDGLTRTVLTEVKNVKSLSYTQQLRDFATHASQNGLRFDLWVRPTTQLSGPLAKEVAKGAVNLRFIP